MTASISTDMYLAAFPTILKEFHTNPHLLNYTLVCFFIFFAVSMLFSGSLSDKYGRKKTLLFCLLLYSLSSLSCSLSTNVHMMIGSRIFQALGAGGIVSVATAVVKDSFNDSERPRIIAIIQMLAVLAPTCAPIMGALIMKYFNWQASFIFISILGAILFLVTLLFKETLPEDDRVEGNAFRTFATLGNVLKNKAFIYFLLATYLIYLAYLSFIAVSSYIYISWFNLSATQYSIFFALNSLALMIGPRVYLKVKNHFPPSKFMKLSLGLMLFSAVLTLSVGEYSPYLFFLTFLPTTFCNTFLRSFASNILLGQEGMNGGAVASVINFGAQALGAIGMVLGALSWPNGNYVFGVGVVSLFAFFLSVMFFLLFKKNNSNFKGYV